MALGEDAAYALAAWHRFGESVGDGTLRAVAGAFALVAASDGNLAREEIDRFVALIRDRGDVFPGLDLQRLESSFRDIGEALLSDPDAGREQALRYVAAVKDDAQQRELVRSAAEIALVADGRKLGREEVALRQICSALDLAPRG